MRVVIREGLRRVELINRQPACLAGEEFSDGPIVNGAHLRTGRRRDAEGVMPSSARARVVERVRESACGDTLDRYQQIAAGKRINRLRDRRYRRFDRWCTRCNPG